MNDLKELIDQMNADISYQAFRLEDVRRPGVRGIGGFVILFGSPQIA